MLQITISLLLLIFSFPAFAQYYQDGNVPAFLRNEATGNQQPPQPFQNPSQPAFLQAEQQQQIQQAPAPTVNYQSADPNSPSFTLPPANYEQTGEEPEFMKREADQAQQQTKVEQGATGAITQNAPEQTKSDPNENVIKINFSEDQYKPEDEVVEVKQDEEKKEGEVAHESEEEQASKELVEGSKLTEEEQKLLKEKKDAENIGKTAVVEPKKNETNIIRINYDKSSTILTDNDKTALNSVVSLLKNDKNKKIRIKSYTSTEDFNNDFRRIGLQRVINIRDYLMKQGVNFSQTEVKVFGAEKNKEDLDYIDIDKI